MHFQVFIPGVRGCDPDHLAAVGLESLCAGARFLEVQQGPPDAAGAPQPGSVIFWQPAPGHVGYKPDAQTWLPAVADRGLPPGRYQVGITNALPPTPEELQRPYAYAGELVEFGDGRQWLVPQLERLPHDMIRADDGSWGFVVQRQFHDLWLQSKSIARTLFEHTSWTRQDFATLAEFVLRLLCVNHRLTPEVANHLRLFQSGDAGNVLLAALLACEGIAGDALARDGLAGQGHAGEVTHGD